MTYPYEDLLRAKAQAFATAIRSQLAYDAQIDPKSYREYSVALKLGDVSGKATIYYSPKKKTYKLVNQGIDDSTKSLLNEVWESFGETASVKEKEPLSKPKTKHQAYVDGSYHAKRKTVGYGAIILEGNNELTRLSGGVNEFTESRQIGGELEAAKQVVLWCQQHNISEIDIYYDYKGIELWATGRWKTEKPISRQYKQFMKSHSVKIHWHKVKSHTGIKWNDVADELAKQGALS